MTEFEMIAQAFLQRKNLFPPLSVIRELGCILRDTGGRVLSQESPFARRGHQDHLLARPLFTKSDLFWTISIFVFVQTGHFELIFSDRVSPSGRDFLRKRYLEGELRDGEDLPNCYDQVRQKNTSPQKLRIRGSPSPLVHSV